MWVGFRHLQQKRVKPTPGPCCYGTGFDLGLPALGWRAPGCALRRRSLHPPPLANGGCVRVSTRALCSPGLDVIHKREKLTSCQLEQERETGGLDSGPRGGPGSWSRARAGGPLCSSSAMLVSASRGGHICQGNVATTSPGCQPHSKTGDLPSSGIPVAPEKDPLTLFR